uniref:PDZ domain-containing protein n=1 Tax=Anisakis simplex TaxID=6269 RepID=A0A0M3K6D1_ANISI
LVLEDAYLELLVAVSTPDWIGRPPIPKNLDFDKIEQRESTADEEGASEAEEREESSCPQLDKEIDELVSQAVIHTKNGLAENFEEVARSEKEISPEVVTSSPKEGEKAQLERGDSREGDECGECKQETRSERNKDNDEDRESDLPMATPTATPPPAGADIKAATEQKRQCSQEQQQPKQQEASPEQPKIVPMGRSKFWGEARTVILNREPNQSFGISIVGGRVEVSQRGGLPGTGNTVSGIFIKSVLPNSPAGRSGLMNMGDRVISVNEHDLRDSTHDQAVYLIKNASNPVRFVVQSLHSFSPQQMVTFGVAPSTSPSSILKKPESVIPSRASTEDSWRSIPEKEEGDQKISTKDANKPQGSKEEQSDAEIERDEPHKQTEGGEKAIDRNKAAKVGIEPGSAAYLERSQSDSEPEDAFLYTKVALKSTCPLPIKVGDELLEARFCCVVIVNGRVLLGLSHLNASARIRECCEEGTLELLLLRRFDALEQMAIRPEPMLSRSRTSPACDQDSASLVETTLIPGRRRQPGEPTREDDGGEEEDDDRDSEEKQQKGGGSAGTEESAGIEETKKESSEVAETKEESLSRASSSSSSCNASREAKV